MPDTFSLRLSRRTAAPQSLTVANPRKRAFDITASLLLLLLFTPLLLFISITIRLGGSPALFRQLRAGAGGRPFNVLKFRTMRPDGGGFAQARLDDPRVTRIGRFLRRNSLDELLQLLNVLAGDMSLVGPRPHAPETTVEGQRFEEALPHYRQRRQVKPGMTGLAQIRGQRGETRTLAALEQRIASDLEYIENWSMRLDLVILLKTIPAVLRQSNAC